VRELTIVLKIAVIVFLGEALIMAALSLLGVEFSWAVLFGDSLSLTALSSPFIYFLVIKPFVTARDAAEAARHYVEDSFRAVAASTTDAIIAIDSMGSIVMWSEGAADVFGYTEAEMLGKTLDRIIPERLRRQHDETLGRIVHGQKAHLIGSPRVQSGVRRDGTEFPLEMTLGSWQANGKTYFSAVLRDITERIAQETRARQADKMDALGNLAGGIAHDLKNLLFPIISLTTMSIRDLPEDSRTRKRLEKVLQAGERANQLVRRIHAFSHLDEEGKEKVEISTAMEGALDLLHCAIPKYLGIKIQLTPQVGVVEVDLSQLQTVLMNLTSNAVDAMDKGHGTLSISLTRVTVSRQDPSFSSLPHEGDFACIKVSDTGAGMDETTLSQIFVPYFTTKKRGHGTGLGMPMVQKFVTRHEGAITVESLEGKGTTFRIYLPIISDAES